MSNRNDDDDFNNEEMNDDAQQESNDENDGEIDGHDEHGNSTVEITEVVSAEEKEDFKKLLNGEMNNDDGTPITALSNQVDTFPEKIMAKKFGYRSLVINTAKLCEWIPTLRLKIRNYPSQILDQLAGVFDGVLREKHGEELFQFGDFHVRITPELIDENAIGRMTTGFDNLNAGKIGKLVNLRGVITAISKEMEYPTKLVFKCTKCNERYVHVVERYGVYYPPPKVCTNEECAGKASWRMDSFASKFVDFQRLTIQEEPEYLKTRDQPRDTKVAIIDDIVGIIKPGSHISISGMVLATPKFKENQQMYDYALFDTNVYGFNVETKVEEENDKDKLPDERKELIMKFVRDHENNREEYFKYLTDSIAPTIYGHNEVKLAMIAAVLGGQAYSAQKYTKIRPYVHVLIVGDPGTGKSEIIQWIKNVVTRYEYASGQGSSKAGLTAAVVHDKGEDPELQAGTTVLADGGIAAIDEMDKMGDNDKSALHEQMEHGRVTINKWKFHESLNARATIIGAANPKHGQVLDPARGKSIQEQLSMIPIAIQTRFDLIFLFMDIPTEANDREMAKKMREARSIEFAISQDDMTSNKEEENELQERTNFIRDLFTFAKHVANDRKIGITDSAAKLLEDFYVKLRHRVMDDDGSRRADLPIPITTRQYGSLDRIATAFAKATFSDKVDDDHMNRAINLMNESMRQTFMDENGNIDATMASTGISKAKIDKNDTILRTLYYEEERAKKEDKNIDGVDKAKLKERILSDTRIREEEFKRTIDDLVKNGLIKEVAGGKRIRLTAPGRHEIGID